MHHGKFSIAARWPDVALLGIAIAVVLLWPDDAPSAQAVAVQRTTPAHLKVAPPGMPLEVAADPFGARNWAHDPVGEAAPTGARP